MVSVSLAVSVPSSDRLPAAVPPMRTYAILDAANGPLIAVRLNVITRKSLGGLHTDIEGRVLAPDGTVLDGLFAAGEASGFGGDGYHGYNALEGTFLGGCVITARVAAKAIQGKKLD